MFSVEALMTTAGTIAHIALALSDNVEIVQKYVNARYSNISQVRDRMQSTRIPLVRTFRALATTAHHSTAAAHTLSFYAHEALTQKPLRKENLSLHRYFSISFEAAQQARQKLQEFDNAWDSAGPLILSYRQPLLTRIWNAFGNLISHDGKPSAALLRSDAQNAAAQTRENSRTLNTLIAEIEQFWRTLMETPVPSSFTEQELYTIEDSWKRLEREWADREKDFSLLEMGMQKLEPLTLVRVDIS